MLHRRPGFSIVKPWLYGILLFSLPQAAPEPASSLITQYLQQTSAPEDIIMIFRGEENPNYRAEIVQNCDVIARRYANDLHGSALPEWAATLLSRALEDKHIYVIESAIRQIGKLKAVQFETQLIDLYGKLPKRFGGNPVPMQREIIAALGQVDGQMSVEFLTTIIDKHIVGDASDATLQAMEASCDNRYSGTLYGYISYLEGRISEGRQSMENLADTAQDKKAQARKLKETWTMDLLTGARDRAVRARDAIRRGCSHE